MIPRKDDITPMNRANRPHPYIPATRSTTLLLPLIAFGAGFAVMFSQTTLRVEPRLVPYLSLALIAGMDSVLGGVRAGLEGKFSSDVFMSGFVLNTIAAVALAYFGDAIGLQDLFLGAVVVFAWRILVNISVIRRFFIERARVRREAAAQATPLPSPIRPGAEDIVGA